MPTTSKFEKTSIAMPEDFSPSAGALVEDRRASMRLAKRMTAKLLGAGGDTQCCVTEDVSEGGLYLCVPSEVGLCVGQRCELVLVEDEESDQQSSLTDEPIFATVMRTSVVMHGGSRFIGAGMRFDQPLYL